MNQHRRKFITMTATTATLLGGSAAVLSAQEISSEPQDKVIADISANHGHDLELNIADLVQLYRAANDDANEEVKVEIQGTSPHPHSVVLNAAEINAVLLGETITKVSSSEFGHTHNVVITLEITVRGDLR